ncbi:YrzI family small protein [Brevibacillus dissolubilis]|uniref:YrzI family small protein n=1 Tax=Brevibacillus dissolubilis TaxID=1844116 RepID=UPI001115E1E4|nr:YrzI family small protein [Brevibacillus dissolubilis]
MQIPMIFFTIIIERRRKSASESLAQHQQEQVLAELETKRHMQYAEYPVHCTRI